jgi:hypothetical protein
MSKHQELETKLNSASDFISVVGLGGMLLSGILLFTPGQAVGYIGVGSGFGAIVTAGITKKKHYQVASQHSKELLNYADKLTTEYSQKINIRDGQIDTLSTLLTELEAEKNTQKLKLIEIKQSFDSITQQYQTEITKLTQQNEAQKQLVERITGELDRLLEVARANVETSVNDWNTKLFSLIESKKKLCPKLTERLGELLKEGTDKLDYWETKLNQTPDKWDSLGDLLNIYYWLNDDLTNIKTKAIQSISKLSLQEKMAEIEELDQLVNEWNDAKLMPRDKVQKLIEKYQAMLQELGSEYSSRFNSIIGAARNYEESISKDDEFFAKLKGEIQRLEATVHKQEMLLREANQIRLFDDIGWKSEVANKVLHHFQLNEIVCDACPMPIREVSGDLEFWLTPRTRIGMNLIKAELEKVAESLRLPLGVKYIKVALDGKNVKIRLPFEDREVKKASPSDVLGRPVSTWKSYLGSEYHRLIFAATQSGKTLLADELNGMQYTQLDGLIEFEAITLKNDGNRDEEKMQRFICPSFKSCRAEYMQALDLIHEAIEIRNEILKFDPNHRFNRQIFQLDEYGEYFRLGSEEERKAGKNAIISLMQSGAGLSSETGKGISLTLIAQNPYVSQLGLFRPDLAAACIIIVGEKNIRLFLDSDKANHGLDEDDLERLTGELKLFKEASRIASDKAKKIAELQGDDARLAVRRCPENYYSLIVPSKGGLPPVIVYNPKPGEFTNGLIKTVKTESKPTCPKCQTVSTRKKGNQGRYYCDNQACSQKALMRKSWSNSGKCGREFLKNLDLPFPRHEKPGFSLPTSL